MGGGGGTCICDEGGNGTAAGLCMGGHKNLCYSLDVCKVDTHWKRVVYMYYVLDMYRPGACATVHNNTICVQHVQPE